MRCLFTTAFARLTQSVLLLAITAGCSIVQQKAVPVERVPDWMMSGSKANREPINLISLRVDPPPVYELGARDILGVYIEGVLGTADSPPPVHFPEHGDEPPALGYPVPIREDGRLYLPLIAPLNVAGMTLADTEDAVRRRYFESGILAQESGRIMITLIRKRTNQILVVREDSGAAPPAAGVVIVGPTKRGGVTAVDLPVDESDIMHALAASGGLPGLDAKNEVVILRGTFNDATQRARFLGEMKQLKEYTGPSVWIKPDSNVLRIPLRTPQGMPAQEWSQEDIRLRTGDIVFIETREREVFYTGGLLPGREMPLPRDYDLDVLAAISLAGGSAATGVTAVQSGGGGGGFGGGGGGSAGIVPPTQIIVVRRLPNGATVPIRINLNRAILNNGERILVQPGDYVLLQYTPMELAANIVLGNVSFSYFLNKIE